MYPSSLPQNGATFTTQIHNTTYDFISSATQSNHSGRAVFITGGDKGIGRAIAMSFARAGASHIGVGSIGEFGELAQELREAAHQAGHSTVPTVLSLRLDVTDSASIRAAAGQVRHDFSSLDVLINDAGYITPALRIVDADELAWWKTFEVNFSASGLQTMVDINSVAAYNPRLNASAYGTSKMAALKFVEFLLAEQASQGFLAYSVHPGGIMTDLAKAMPENTHSSLTDDPKMTGDFIAFLTRVKREWLAGTYLSCTWDMEELLSQEQQIRQSDNLKVRLILPEVDHQVP